MSNFRTKKRKKTLCTLYVRILNYIKTSKSSKLGHVGSKYRSLGRIVDRILCTLYRE